MAENGADLGKAYVQIVPSAKGIKSSLGEVLGRPLEEQGDTSGQTFGSKLVSKIKGVITVASIGKFLSASLTEGGALQQSIGGVETLFGSSADKIKKAASTAFRDAGISANEYMEQATSFAASLVSSCGGNTSKAADIANMALQDMSDNANKMGTDMVDIQNAYQGFAKQNYTMLDNLKLGYGGTQEEMKRLLTDAQKITGVKYDINNLGDVYNAIHAIQQKLGVTGTTAKEASTTLTGSFSMVKASAKDFLGALSTGSNVFQSFQNMMGSLGTFISGNLVPMLMNIGTSIGTVLGGIADRIPTMLPSILAGIQSFASSLASQAPAFIQSGFNLLNRLADGIIAGIPILIQRVPTIISTLANIINNNAPTIMVCGLKLIAKLALGLIQAIPTLIANIPKIIMAIVNVWSAFNWLQLGRQAITGLGNGIKAMFGSLKSAGSGILNAVKSGIANLPGALKNLAKSAMYNLSETISGMGSAARTAMLRVASAIETALRTLPGKMLSIGKNIMQGLIKGIAGATGWVLSMVSGVAKSIVNAFKSFLKIKSPSRVMRDEVGRFIGEGVGVGILGSFDTVRKDIASFNDSLVDEFSKTDSLGASMTFSAVREVKMQMSAEGLAESGARGTGDIYQTINITAPDAVDPSEITRQTRNANRELIQRLKGA